jgi:sec-independent protein translocase protein TatC
MALRDFFRFRELEDEPKPLLQHLDELRAVLIRIVAAVAVCMIFAFVFRAELAAIIQWPLAKVDPDRAANLQSLGVADSMMVSLQLSFYAGLVLAFPMIMYFLAQFIVPALTELERRILFPGVAVGLLLFLAGALFAYFIVLPQTLEFFAQDAKAMSWAPTWTVREYFSFTTQFIIAFGFAFELPVLVFVLHRLGFVTAASLKRTRSFAVVLIFLFAAILTPTQDVITLLMMGLPMLLLYEACILAAVFLEKRERHALGL